MDQAEIMLGGQYDIEIGPSIEVSRQNTLEHEVEE